jgi:hypothetical protein
MNYRILIFSAIIGLHLSKTSAQKYPVSSIPDSLIENANCVIRNDTREFELKSINTAVIRSNRVITVLNKNGDDDASLFSPYNKNSSVVINLVILYDAGGKTIKKVKSSEIIDSPFTSSGLYSEEKIKAFQPKSAVYPYTVEYDYVINSTNMISYGAWHPMTGYNISVEHSGVRFTYPNTLKVNRKEVNVPVKSFRFQKDNKITESWEMNNLKAVEVEPFETDLSERTPVIYFMPSELVYDDFTGKANTWEEYGLWVKTLYAGKDQLSDPDKIKVDQLLKNVTDTLQIIKTLYKYMQENTRYVSITLGIGGFQPYDAKTVSSTGYGDCKALTNYMYSLLKYKGIQSYPALVAAGRYIESIFTDFPNFLQFNHVILCVPNKTDTIWLECTSQVSPFGFTGDFTDDREVLLITENGGKFTHTKKYELSDNLRISNSLFVIDSSGTATCTLNTNFSGLQYDDVIGLLHSNADDQKKWLYARNDLPSSQITGFSIVNTREPLPVAKINESIISRHYGSFSGKYMIIPLNLVNIQKPVQKMLKPRYSDILVSRSSVDYDTVVFRIPQNYKPESVPSGFTINSDFGEYSSSISLTDNEIVYTRRFSIFQGKYKSTEYKKLYDFILAISKADNIKVMLTKK